MVESNVRNSRSRLKKCQNANSNSLKKCSSLSDSFSSTSGSSNSLAQGEEGFVPLALPGSSLLKTAFYPTHTSMTNLNKCFSARF